MEAEIFTSSLPGWVFGSLVIAYGIMNFMWVHAVPGIAYFILSCIYLPPAYAFLQKWFHFFMPLVFKIFLGLVIILFTFGVSDLGDMIDKL